MLHELVFLGYYAQFASYPYSFASYSYSCKILQLYVAARAQKYSDAVFSSVGASRTKTLIKTNARQQIVVLLKNHSRFGFGSRVHVNQPYPPHLSWYTIASVMVYRRVHRHPPRLLVFFIQEGKAQQI